MNRYPNHPIRQSSGSARFYGAPVTKWLMIALVVFFVADVAGGGQIGRFKPWFALGGGTLHEVWRWVTYSLVDFNVISWLFSLMILYSFGRIIEQSIGSRRFATFTVYCVLAGALVYSLMSMTGVNMPLTGANSVTIGLVVAAAMLYPEQQVQLMLPPMPVKLKSLAMFVVGFVVIMSIAQRVDPAVSLAHLSGVAVAYFCMKKVSLLDFGKGGGRKGSTFKRSPAQRKKKTKKKVGMKARSVLNMSESKREAEVNKILDKVSAEGIGNLSDEEKEILKFAAKND